ncbi:MAG: family 20 glycosylhydrolase [Bacteroidaceae bacterium]|nr:family 20 glycosylhydrolase [Bacteroidaceae bacterium]
MTRHVRACIFALLLLTCNPLSAAVKERPNPRPFTIPAIHEWKGGKGTLTLSPTEPVTYADMRLRPVAERLAEDLSLTTGQTFTAKFGKKAANGGIHLSYKKQKELGDEGYTMNIRRSVNIEATERGAMHATQTLLQILNAKGAPTIACGDIADRPDYPIRGLMLDCGRKYIPLDYMLRLARTMAYYKMNTLCVHLNDNGFQAFFHDNWDETYSAFRMESELFPGLTAEDGSYSKHDFRQFVMEAAQLGVEVIPEIDVPAHSLAFSHYRPSLGSREFGADHLDLGNPEVIPFLDSLFAEYIEGPQPIFAGPRIHIGTDEYSNRRKETVEQFRHLTNHLINHVEKYGKQAVLWGSLTHAKGTTPVKVDSVLMFSWSNDYAEPDSMHRLGYHLLSIPDGYVYIVPAAGYYYDYLNIPFLYRKWTPAVAGRHRFEERDPQVEGGLFAVWNDIVGNGIAVADIHHRVFPAMQVIAEKCWSPDTIRTLESWQELAISLSEAPGINDLGRYPKGVVITQAEVTPNSTRKIKHIGYPYRVSFDIEAAAEQRGTALFRNDDAEFYISDPVTGRIGFSRDGYLFSFRHSLKPGAKEHLCIEGDNKKTSLFVNGRCVETLGPDKRQYPHNKQLTLIRTLRFPLSTTDSNVKSRVTNLKVESLQTKN